MMALFRTLIKGLIYLMRFRVLDEFDSDFTRYLLYIRIKLIINNFIDLYEFKRLFKESS